MMPTRLCYNDRQAHAPFGWSVMKPEHPELETDPRFPSGPWTGFFLQKPIPGRHLMEMHLTFCAGRISGAGRDWVGEFTIAGDYALDSGRCSWAKQYVGRHTVHYRGYNEGKGIWGTWEMDLQLPPDYRRGGFHIWPEGQRVGSGPELSEEADVPANAELISVR
jgi:hypothetical protein